MGSGPRAGLGEIFLPELQKGSSIMPGKVNPVIPEVVTQVAAQVIGNDQAITVGGMSGQFELNVYVPLMARNLLQSIRLLGSASRLLAEKCVDGIEANREQLERYAELTLSAATALNPYIGYDKAAEIVEEGGLLGAVAARGRARRRGRGRLCSTRRSTTGGWRSRTTSVAIVPLDASGPNRLVTPLEWPPSGGQRGESEGDRCESTFLGDSWLRSIVGSVPRAVFASSAFAGGDPIVVQSSGTTSFAGKGSVGPLPTGPTREWRGPKRTGSSPLESNQLSNGQDLQGGSGGPATGRPRAKSNPELLLDFEGVETATTSSSGSQVAATSSRASRRIRVFASATGSSSRR